MKQQPCLCPTCQNHKEYCKYYGECLKTCGECDKVTSCPMYAERVGLNEKINCQKESEMRLRFMR
ncbi:hypothetical protein SAMN04515679_1776 [Pelosinus fermentans]|uniref:Uncharacterized protein n=1 Tax=Pelosinus fermentans B4 TaxID=1149862 RepID=I8RNQ5_9FIRM|nr:hypothetical protein FB4_1952 [Pelosinus fermentans B4]EIW25415.1 hypothetical protein FA11_2574 [Pelosinus fermentans A11]OAM93673.1 hypothetical protein FR7_01690 [Pelosinus fermentans DSM 17108]SDQ86120.1 hypothetical protein SAMN04515679_1776 [Pelosinus fermentans]